MTLVRWNDPFRDLVRLHDQVGRVFGGSYGPGDTASVPQSGWVPLVDIYQSGDHELVIKAELPDMVREDIDVGIENGTLTIKGERKRPQDVKDEQFHRVERRFGPFTRSFALPRTVDTAKVGAEYKNGVLTVRLPLREDAKPRQIRVDVAA